MQNVNMFNPDYIDISKSKEENLSELIIIKNSNSSHLENINIIYETLIQIKKFKHFMLINNFNKDIGLKILKAGILKSYNSNEEIYKKKEKPQFYFLVLTGLVSYNNIKDVLTPGSFFGDEIYKVKHYKHNAFALKDKTILLLLPRLFFNQNLKNKIVSANEKIKNSFVKNFTIFKKFDNIIIEKYLEKKMTKLFPDTGEIIISNKDNADSIFIIYKGNCSLNIGENYDAIILGQDNIFGIESLNNIDEKGVLLDNKYLYNIINKSPNSIILKFSIKNFHLAIINDLKEKLIPSLIERNDIIQKHEKMKENLKNKLVKKYQSLEGKKNRKKLLIADYKEISSEIAENSYNNEIKNLIQLKKSLNDKRKFLHKNSCFSMKNIINKGNLIDKMKKSNSCINILENNQIPSSDKRRKIMKNIFLKKNSLDIKKIISNTELKKLIDKKKETKEIKNNSKEKIPNSNRSFNDQNIINKKNIFFTTRNKIRNKRKQPLSKIINIINLKGNTHTYRKKLTNNTKDEKVDEFSSTKDNGTNTIFGSTFRDSISFIRKRKYVSAKKRIESYGSKSLDPLNYFNYDKKENSYYSSIYENKNKKNRTYYRRFLFCEISRYNLPILDLFEKSVTMKLSDIIHK